MAGIYLHIPFCERKCLYCDFYSIENRDGVGKFLHSLEKEITSYGPLAEGTQFSTIFFGGGTPSLLDPEDVKRILSLVRRTFSISADVEVTLETNPGTVTREKLSAFREAGISRLSIGVQSFHQHELEFLGRIHSVREAEECLEWGRELFGNYSIDLIYALPGQQPGAWSATLQRAIATGAPHISAYSLIVEEHTPLARLVASGQVTPLPTDRDAALYEHTMDVLRRAGYEHYEVSNYARPGARSRHNSGYWDHSPYLGFGPSSHSLWGKRRWWNVSNLNAYNSMIESGAKAVSGEEDLTASQILDEAVMLSLRTGGIEFRVFQEKYGVDVSVRAGKVIARLGEDRLAEIDGISLRLTDKGFLFCDQISASILAALS